MDKETTRIVDSLKLKECKRILSKLHPKDLDKLINDKFVYVLNFVEMMELVFNPREELKQLSRLKRSNKNEQKLFEGVYATENIQKTKNYKFSPFETFKKINDNLNLIDDSLLQEKGFSTKSKIFNRYKQYRVRQQKKNSNPQK